MFGFVKWFPILLTCFFQQYVEAAVFIFIYLQFASEFRIFNVVFTSIVKNVASRLELLGFNYYCCCVLTLFEATRYMLMKLFDEAVEVLLFG